MFAHHMVIRKVNFSIIFFSQIGVRISFSQDSVIIFRHISPRLYDDKQFILRITLK